MMFSRLSNFLNLGLCLQTRFPVSKWVNTLKKMLAFFPLVLIKKNTKPYLYFETSAINHLHDVMTPEEAETLSKLISLKGNQYRVSSLVFWEVLLTADDLRRESLVYFLQHFVPYPPIASPEELIIKWLHQGCPLEEARRPIETKTYIGKVWADIHKNKQKTFVLNRHDLANRLNLLRKLGHSLRRAILAPHEPDELLGIVIMDTIDPFVKNLSFVKDREHVTEEQCNLYRVSVFFVVMIFCGNLSLESEIIDTFWKDEGVHEQHDRLIHFLKKYEIAICTGPIATMAVMALHQIKQKKSRGLWADCLHSVYIPYADRFHSADDHFCSLIGTDSHFNKISDIRSFPGFKS